MERMEGVVWSSVAIQNGVQKERWWCYFFYFTSDQIDNLSERYLNHEKSGILHEQNCLYSIAAELGPGASVGQLWPTWFSIR